MQLAVPEIRRCAVCDVQDEPMRHVAPDFTGLDGATWIDDHTVTVELRWLKKAELNPQDAARGWKLYPGLFQGKPAMQRFICRPCLNSQAIVRKDFEKKAASELRKVNDQSFYMVLCD